MMSDIEKYKALKDRLVNKKIEIIRAQEIVKDIIKQMKIIQDNIKEDYQEIINEDLWLLFEPYWQHKMGTFTERKALHILLLTVSR